MRPEEVYLIPVHDADALVEGIEILAKKSGRTKIEKPDDKSNITKVLDIYREVYARRKSRQTEKKELI
jgi:hypothetical protein